MGLKCFVYAPKHSDQHVISLHNIQYIVKQTGDENKEKHKFKDVALIYTTKLKFIEQLDFAVCPFSRA